MKKNLSLDCITAEEHLAELMPIFEQLRAQGDLPCTYPLHVSSFGTAFIRGGSRSTPLSPHAPHCHPSTHWVSFSPPLLLSLFRYQKRRQGNVFFLLLLLLPVGKLIWIWYMSLWVERNIDNNLFPPSTSTRFYLSAEIYVRILSSRLAI